MNEGGAATTPVKEKTLIGGSGGAVTVVCRFRPFNDREKNERG